MGNALARLDAAIRAAGIPIDGVSGGTTAASVVVQFQDAATAPQRTQAAGIVAAHDYSGGADATADAKAAKAAATDGIQNGGLKAAASDKRLVYALSLMILDEFNIHSTWESALLGAIAAATTLADLKTRVAAISPNPVQRTALQVQNAVIAKINATAE